MHVEMAPTADVEIADFRKKEKNWNWNFLVFFFSPANPVHESTTFIALALFMKSYHFDKKIFLQIYFGMVCMLTNSLVLILFIIIMSHSHSFNTFGKNKSTILKL
jgi:hypothetical protein